MDERAWDERYREAPLLWGAQPNRLFAELATPLEPGRALDLAAGEGRNALWLASLGWDVVAVDFSPVAIERGRMLGDKANLEVRFECADLQTYEPEESAFDLVAILYLHLSPATRRTVLERAARALAPGGTLIVIGHDVRNIAEGVGGPQDPTVLLSPEVVASELPGCDITRAETVSRRVEDGGRDALDTLVIAHRG